MYICQIIEEGGEVIIEQTNDFEDEEERVEGNDNYTNECNANSEEIIMVVLGEDDDNLITCDDEN